MCNSELNCQYVRMVEDMYMPKRLKVKEIWARGSFR